MAGNSVPQGMEMARKVRLVFIFVEFLAKIGFYGICFIVFTLKLFLIKIFVVNAKIFKLNFDMNNTFFHLG